MSKVPIWVWLVAAVVLLSAGSAIAYINRKGILPSEPRTVPVEGIVIHHTTTAKAAATESVLKARDLSTHFEVDQEGRVYQYLDPATEVAWATGAGANKHTIAIDVTHLSGKPWPEVQILAMRQLVQTLADRFGFSLVVAPDNVRKDWVDWAGKGYTLFRHRNFKPTACPEDFPMDRMV